MTNRDLISLEQRRKESQEQSTLRRLQHVHNHRGHTWFLLGALAVVAGLGVLAFEVFKDTPTPALVAGSIVVCILGALVIMDWWERA